MFPNCVPPWDGDMGKAGAMGKPGMADLPCCVYYAVQNSDSGIHTHIPFLRNIFFSMMVYHRTPLVTQMVKSLPAKQETRVRSLGQEDPLEEAWQPIPVFLPGKSQGQRSLAGYSLWGHKESDMTERRL